MPELAQSRRTPSTVATLRLYEAWLRAGARVEAHAYTSGGHGFGMTKRGTAPDRWFDDFCAWLATAGF